VCARACAVKKNREGWKNESADDDGGGVREGRKRGRRKWFLCARR